MKKYLSFGIIACTIFVSIDVFSQNTFPSSGNVGIGTTDPKSKLHLSTATSTSFTNNVPYDALLMIGGMDDQFSGQLINFKNPSYNDANDMMWWSADVLFGRYKNIAKWSFKENHGTPYGQSVKDIIYAKLQDAAGYTRVEKLVLLPDTGNVGIGTNYPQAKLAVNGDIYARKVKVTQTGWSDYVFYADYKLRPLSEVERFILQHRHLPEVPSAAEVEKDGIDLGDNQATLLKKIEELTLYIISMNKEMEGLKKEIKQIKAAHN